MQEKLYFYYTNDLHSNFKQWPKVATFMKTAKEKREKANDSYWLFDIGDHIDRVHPISEALLGKGNITLLNEIGYDVVTIGNNEGITFAHEDLFQLYDNAKFHVVCANLENKRGENPNWLKPTVQIQSNNGIRIGVIGLTAPFKEYYEILGWNIKDIYHTLGCLISKLKEETDIIVLLSHLGISEDQEIARGFSEIDVIIGGHTHHLLRTGEEVNQAIITAGGKHCNYVGEVILTWDHNERKLVKKEAYTTEISNYPNDNYTLELLQELQKKSNHVLGTSIVTIDKPIKVDWYKHSTIMQQLTDFITQEEQADCGMFNTGLLLEGFEKGEITYGDVHRICPHPINPCIVELTGAELIEVIRVSLTKEFMEFELKGLGFRGKVLGKMVFSRIDVETELHSNGQEFVSEVRIHNKPINPDKTYSVITADTFTFGRLLPEVARSERKQYILPKFIRDYFVETLITYYKK
ncbi:bifunctional metallophosphatase/5'-nucleotidase [Ornithinibacillus halotolerans]|uniref:Metallophosphoesterase YunD n=1 Tax=Ornithinibacillus halotolerans TaxID=1274357 RepID=A0A916S0L3_9BACI|nr:bifunctional UDP-sugar hydrolase/5'-nucleotidase [Ornithinibacillus halotolerans]GGA76804.1 putative metallophosphoesterase YunD [Ornithinibacillus halotolerans]